jgi:hypothetical protein
MNKYEKTKRKKMTHLFSQAIKSKTTDLKKFVPYTL